MCRLVRAGPLSRIRVSIGWTATPQEALDCALGLYLNDPTAWQTDPQQD